MASNAFKRDQQIKLIENVRMIIQQNSKNIPIDKLSAYYYLLGSAATNFHNGHVYDGGICLINKILSNLILDNEEPDNKNNDSDIFNSLLNDKKDEYIDNNNEENVHEDENNKKDDEKDNTDNGVGVIGL